MGVRGVKGVKGVIVNCQLSIVNCQLSIQKKIPRCS